MQVKQAEDQRSISSLNALSQKINIILHHHLLTPINSPRLRFVIVLYGKFHLDICSSRVSTKSLMARSFSTAARALLQFIWKGTDSVPQYEAMIERSVSKNPKLEGADKIEIEYEALHFSTRITAHLFRGREHTSRADPVSRVSGKIFRSGVRITSVHAYEDGRVVYSKEEINKAQE